MEFLFPLQSPSSRGHRTFTDDNTKKSDLIALTNYPQRVTLIENREKPLNHSYDKPLTYINQWFSYSERLEKGTRSFVKIAKEAQYTRGEITDTIIEVWQVDLTDLACTIHDDPEWREFLANGQKMTVKATENI